MPDCATISQLLRWPNNLLIKGKGIRSTTGAQNTLIEYIMPIQLKKRIVVRLTSESLDQADRVEKTNKKGRPAEKPKKNIPTIRGFV